MNKPIRESEARTVRDLKELLPDRWKLIKLKLVCDIETGFAFPSEVFGDTGTPVIRITDIKDREINLSEIKRVDDLLLKSKPKCPSVNKGDIIMAMTGATIGKVGYYNSDKPSYLNQRVCRFIPASIDRGYLWHTLNSEIYKKYIELEAFGGAQANISDSQLLNFPAPLPELEEEQQKIAQFLDYETAKIDALIDEQKRLIELLKEKRQAVISHAVTKGLNANVPMKDSGVEWLGEVPEHWEVRKLSSITDKITNGYVGPTRGLFAENGVRYLQSLHIKNNEIIFKQPYYVTPEWSSRHSKSILNEGDVLVVQTGDIGQSALVTKEFEGSNCHALIVISAIRHALKGKYLSWVLNSPYGKNSLMSIKTGALHPHLNCGYVKDVRIPLPPIGEQVEISKSIEDKLTLFKEMTDTALDVAKLLSERRSALISAAVTGKIDVRDWQPPAGSDTVDSNASVQTERHYG